MLQLLADVQNWLAGLKNDERGATAVEYGLIVALIAAVIIFIVSTLGEEIRDAFDTIVGEL
ncbi:MAG: Flp family type IVb pilin [Actinobacteria bacterium]|nr:Flp family type IVb pilin [Actinomycetota bacterium]